MRTTILLFAIAITACTSAHRGNDTDGGVDAEVHVLQCGDELCIASPQPTCIDGDTLRTYDGAVCEGDAGAQTCAYPSHQLECGVLGCCGDHCCTLYPSNSPKFGALQPTGLDIEIVDQTFDTAIDCTATSALGACTFVEDACVCRSDTIRIRDLHVVGSAALVLFAHRTVLVTGTLDVSAHGSVDGPGASYSYTAQPPTTLQGGPGGSFGSRGADTSVASAAEAGAQTLVPLEGGMRGMSSVGGGGGGGGALQITAGLRIEIVGTIDAGGGGGQTGTTTDPMYGGGGGGSGGGILLEAPNVFVGGMLLANGGGGGGGGGRTAVGAAGWNASAFREHGAWPTQPAHGGVGGYWSCGSSTEYAGIGGDGASGPIAASKPIARVPGCAGDWGVGEGGGGGGVGRIRINSEEPCECTGTVLPAATFGTVSEQ